jgi:hypothetical protein
MIVSFTGTHRGMRPAQFERVTFAVAHVKLEVGIHGGCHGADREFHGIVHPRPLHIYPSNEEQARWAFEHCEGGKDVVHPYLMVPKYELVRNMRMIDASKATIATPSGFNEISRGSGTWQSIRYARGLKHYLIICWPDGTATEENKP